VPKEEVKIIFPIPLVSLIVYCFVGENK